MNLVDVVMAIQLAVLFSYFLLILVLAFPLVIELEDEKKTLKFVKRLFRLTWIWLFLFIGSSLLYILT